MTSSVQHIKVDEEQVQQRLDNFLFKILKGVPKSHVYRIIRHGEVRVNKKRAKPDYKLNFGDDVRVPPLRMSESKNTFVSQSMEEQLSSCILYEDDALLVINKPAGIAVHGGSGVNFGIIEALREMRPRVRFLELVHRLDRETSGCLVLAKKRAVLLEIQSQLTKRTVQKIYWALLHQPWSGSKNRHVDAPLHKNSLRSGERIVSVHSEGKPSITNFSLLENFSQYCLVSALPKTGRTHQIRVHAAYLGHPIVGDAKYTKPALTNQTDGCEKENLSKKVKERGHKNRLYLHAHAIQFMLDGKKLRFEAPLDQKFSEMLKRLRLEATL